mgnify:FL=1
MAVTITNTSLAPRYYQNTTEEQIPPISTMQLTGIYLPDELGYFYAEKMNRNSLLTELGFNGSEMTVTNDQVMWREEGDELISNAVKVAFDGATKTFTPSPKVFATDAFNIDNQAPTDVEFIGVEVGMKFTAFDSTGKMNFGEVTSVASDNTSFVAKALGVGVAAFTIGADAEILFTGLNLNDCECPPAIAIKNWAPTFEAQLEKDGVKVEYCKETLAKEGVKFDYIPTPDGTVSVDKRIDDALKALQARAENRDLFGGKGTLVQATASGRARVGSWGLLPYLEKRAMKVEGLVDSDAEVRQIIAELKKKDVYEAEMWCSDAQYGALQLLYPADNAYSFFENHEGDLKYFEFAGVKINGVKLYFKQLGSLSRASEYAGKRYNFFIKPRGKVWVYLNGERRQMDYLAKVYFEAFGEVYKNMREEVAGNGLCGIDEINFYDKSTILAFMPRKWMIGVNVA